MIRPAFVTLLGLALLAGCESAVAPQPSPLGSTLDPDGQDITTLDLGIAASVTANGISSDGASVRVMTVSALRGADGTVHGEYTVVLNGNDRRLEETRGWLMGDVTCVRVVGNRAFIAGNTKKDLLEALPVPIGGVAIEVVDGGEGPGAVDEVSSVGLYLQESSARNWCETTGPGPTFQAQHGEVQVR